MKTQQPNTDTPTHIFGHASFGLAASVCLCLVSSSSVRFISVHFGSDSGSGAFQFSWAPLVGPTLLSVGLRSAADRLRYGALALIGLPSAETPPRSGCPSSRPTGSGALGCTHRGVPLSPRQYLTWWWLRKKLAIASRKHLTIRAWKPARKPASVRLPVGPDDS